MIIEMQIVMNQDILEGIFTKLQPAPLNEAMTLPSEYLILYQYLRRCRNYYFNADTDEGHD